MNKACAPDRQNGMNLPAGDSPETLEKFLSGNRDAAYADFQRRLIPTVPPEAIIGVRTPLLRQKAKELARAGEAEAFLQELPHKYFEENQLQAFLISELRDFEACTAALEAFLPFVDNWATCDQMSPKALKKHKDGLLPFLRRWLASGHTYTVRFAVGMLMQHYLDGEFQPAYLALVSGIQSEEYYINMEIAWYFATALAKQWDAAVPYLEEKRLAPWVHNKTIQKAVESRRISDERKEYLKTLRTPQAKSAE